MDATSKWLELDPSLTERVAFMKKTYTAAFGAPTTPFLLASAPGRAEILGNHTDYNEGYTLSVNIGENLLILGTIRTDNIVELLSMDEDPSVVRFSADSEDMLLSEKSPPGTKEAWSNYCKGVLWSFLKSGMPVKGFTAVIQSTIPIGSGVSSSAAIEMAMAYFIKATCEQEISAEDLVPLCKQAENNYVGAPCGYLDQGTIALADSGWLKIDYRGQNGKPFSWENISLDLNELGYAFVVGFDKATKRELVDGKYAVRQRICKESYPILAALLKRKDVHALRDISSQEFEQVKETFLRQSDQQHINFSAHIIYDNERVLEGQKALENKNVDKFGSIMSDSGKSAIYLYDLGEGCQELSFVYETVLKKSKEWGVAGIRNMGGGFNATTLALVKKGNVHTYKQLLNEAYHAAFGRSYSFISFVPTPAAGMLDITAMFD